MFCFYRYNLSLSQHKKLTDDFPSSFCGWWAIKHFAFLSIILLACSYWDNFTCYFSCSKKNKEEHMGTWDVGIMICGRACEWWKRQCFDEKLRFAFASGRDRFLASRLQRNSLSSWKTLILCFFFGCPVSPINCSKCIAADCSKNEYKFSLNWKLCSKFWILPFCMCPGIAKMVFSIPHTFVWPEQTNKQKINQASV